MRWAKGGSRPVPESNFLTGLYLQLSATHIQRLKKRNCLPTPVYFNTDDWRCKCLQLYLQLPIYSMTTVRSTDRGETWCKHTCLPFIFQQLHSSNKESPPPAANHIPAALAPPLGHLCRDCNTQVFCWTHKRVSSWMDGLDTHSASCGKQRDRAERAWANTGRMLKACFPMSLHVGMTCSPLSLSPFYTKKKKKKQVESPKSRQPWGQCE